MDHAFFSHIYFFRKIRDLNLMSKESTLVFSLDNVSEDLLRWKHLSAKHDLKKNFLPEYKKAVMFTQLGYYDSLFSTLYNIKTCLHYKYNGAPILWHSK